MTIKSKLLAISMLAMALLLSNCRSQELQEDVEEAVKIIEEMEKYSNGR